MHQNGPSEKPEPCVVVIFGASGDLCHRKLIPALYELHHQGLLPSAYAIVGVSRTPKSDEAFREELHKATKEFSAAYEDKAWGGFVGRVHYHAADASDPEAYAGLTARLGLIAREHKVPTPNTNLLFYLSVAPQLYIPIIDALGGSGLIAEGRRWCSLDRDSMPWQRIVVEKPFGEDLESAEDLNRALGRVFEEEATFRIDHYLGKELVQNVLVMRFANRIFEPLWTREHVDHVQVTAAETVGVGSRAANFYDGAGAMRDMIQSHLLEVMALIAMEPPSSYDADALARERIKLFKAITPVSVEEAHEHAALGRYGSAGEGKPAYVEEKGVEAARKTDTFCAIRVGIDNWRWAGVPFYLRSGKRMARKLTEIVVQFKQPPTWMFREIPSALLKGERPPNRIVINIAPDDGVSLRFEAKVPGHKLVIDSVKMDMDYAHAFKSDPVEAYGPLLLDAMRGDRTLYKHRDEVEGAWRVCQPFLDSGRLRESVETYESGTWGPRSSDELLARDGRIWHNPVVSEKR